MMAMFRPELRANWLYATAMPGAPPPMLIRSFVASATSTGAFPPLTMRRTTPVRSKPAFDDFSIVCGKGILPACDSAHMVVDRMPVRQ